MPVLVPRHEPLLLCASEYKNPSSPVQFKMTNSLTNPQQAKQPAVAIGTKATLEIAKRGSGPGVSYGAIHAPQTVGTMGNALSIFDPTHSPGQVDLNALSLLVAAVQYHAAPDALTATGAEPQDVSTVGNATIDRSSVAIETKMGHGPPTFNCTAILLIVVVLGFIFTEPVGLFEDPEKRMVDALSIMLVAVLFYLKPAQCCRGCTVNKGQYECNDALWYLFLLLLLRTLFSIDTMMATVKLIFRTVAFDACTTFCPSVYHDPAKAVVGVVFVDESEHSARKEKVGGHCSAVRRRRCCPGPSALVFLALALLCGIDGGWAAFTPNVREFAKAQKVSLASFENEKNGTVMLCVPGPIIHPSWDKINPSSIVCHGLCLEGQHQGTV